MSYRMPVRSQSFNWGNNVLSGFSQQPLAVQLFEFSLHHSQWPNPISSWFPIQHLDARPPLKGGRQTFGLAGRAGQQVELKFSLPRCLRVAQALYSELLPHLVLLLPFRQMVSGKPFALISELTHERNKNRQSVRMVAIDSNRALRSDSAIEGRGGNRNRRTVITTSIINIEVMIIEVMIINRR